MDINYLLKREQVSLVLAISAATVEARHAHAGLARGYGKMLKDRRFPHRQFRTPPPLLDIPSDNLDRGSADA